MKKSAAVLLLLCLLTVSVAPARAAESAQALDSNPYGFLASWWSEVVSFFGLGAEDLSSSAATSSTEPPTTANGGGCIDPFGRPIVPCVDEPKR